MWLQQNKMNVKRLKSFELLQQQQLRTLFKTDAIVFLRPTLAVTKIKRNLKKINTNVNLNTLQTKQSVTGMG